MDTLNAGEGKIREFLVLVKQLSFRLELSRTAKVADLNITLEKSEHDVTRSSSTDQN